MCCYARQTKAVLRRPVEPGLRTTVGVMNEFTFALPLARVQRLLQRVQYEVVTCPRQSVPV